MDWIATFSAPVLLAVVIWLARNLILTRLTKAVQHEFDIKLERLRTELQQQEEKLKSDLRGKEAEIAAIRGRLVLSSVGPQAVLRRGVARDARSRYRDSRL